MVKETLTFPQRITSSAVNLANVGVKVAIKPHLTIKKLLPSLKGPLDNSEKSCLVYQVLCRDCSFVFIGQTKRDLKSRSDEHKRAIKNQGPDLSALSEHSIAMYHIISWTKAKILKLETDYRKLLSFESWHINAKPHVMNQNDGSSFPAVYFICLNCEDLFSTVEGYISPLCFRLTIKFSCVI